MNHSVLPVPDSSVPKKKSRSAILFAALSLILAAILILQNLGIVNRITDIGKGSSSEKRLEGNGYHSAEEAMGAYITAIKQGDVPAILSTFVIETYVDSYDTKAGLAYTGAWLPVLDSDGTYEIIGSDYERKLRLFARQASIIQKLYGQLINYSAYFGEAFHSFDANSSVPVVFREEKDIENFLSAYHEDRFGKALSEMKLEGFVKPEDLSKPYGSPAHLENMKKKAQIFGCDEYKSVAARVNLNGEDWLITMDCVNFDGRWYNLTPSSTLAAMLGADVRQYGLIPCSQLR